MRAKFTVALVVAGAALVLCVLAYRQMTSTPAPHAATPAGCTPEAIKAIGDITERAIHSSRCAQRVR